MDVRTGVSQFRDGLLKLPRYHKRLLLICVDVLGLVAILWAALWLRYGFFFVPPNAQATAMLLAGPPITVGALWYFDVYRMVTRFMGHGGSAQIVSAVVFSVLVWAVLLFMIGQHGVPRTVILSYGAWGAGWIIASRAMIKALLESAGVPFTKTKPGKERTGTLIYGANRLGVALLDAVSKSSERYVVGFVDSSPSLWRQYVSNLKIYAPSQIEHIIEREKVHEVLIAIPGSRRGERQRIVGELKRFPVSVKILPTYEDVALGHVKLDSLRAIEVSDFVGRDAVTPNVELMERHTTGKSVLITGAAGSIGSELVRQIAMRAPKTLVLVDISESGLHAIAFEAHQLLKNASNLPEIKIVLGSVGDEKLMDQIIGQWNIQTIYHAAAYKHVTIVEENPFAGLENNVLGTATVARCARKHGVERFVLVSTDKAVRPTSIMGASKRLAELVVQGEALAPGTSTVFTLVRFGNVLESSGSVIPLFRRQIQAGGPITVTDAKATRFFMSIPEAAQLVIQSGAMAKGGEVFLLDMGAPVRIDDLARLMVRLSNLEVRDPTNPDGDIEITYVGLRPGEKLNEELLIDADAQPTEHPRIFRSNEPCLNPSRLSHEIAMLRDAIEDRDEMAARAILRRTVEADPSTADVSLENSHFQHGIGSRTALSA